MNNFLEWIEKQKIPVKRPIHREGKTYYATRWMSPEDAAKYGAKPKRTVLLAGINQDSRKKIINDISSVLRGKLNTDALIHIFAPKSKNYQTEITDSIVMGDRLRLSIDLLDNAGRKIGIMKRTFWVSDGKTNVLHDPIKVTIENKDLIPLIQAKTEEEYLRYGVSEIFVKARNAGSYKYAWQGYDFDSEKDRFNVAKAFRKYIKSRTDLTFNKKRALMYGIQNWENSIPTLVHSWDFANWDPIKGEGIGKKILEGIEWSGVKVLDPKFPGFNIGQKYFKAKIGEE
mgnify:CR=1 FL=1